VRQRLQHTIDFTDESTATRRAKPAGVSLAFDTNSPYLDGRAPLVGGHPEQRRYRARFVDDDTPVGDCSDAVEVTAHP